MQPPSAPLPASGEIVAVSVIKKDQTSVEAQLSDVGF